MRQAAIYMTRAAFAIARALPRLGNAERGASNLPRSLLTGPQGAEIGHERPAPRDPPSKIAQVETTLGPAMFSLRLAGAALGFALFNSQLTTCRSPGEGGSEAAPAHTEVKDVTLPGVDTSELTGREKAD